VKGADVAIKDLILEQYRAFVLEECETLALDGLRTLVCASRSLTLHEYNAWSKEYEEANCKLANREEMVARVIAKLERKMEFLGITGVLDKLQEDAQLTVDNLR
jgi:phospholipid-translocating ATPase